MTPGQFPLRILLVLGAFAPAVCQDLSEIQIEKVSGGYRFPTAPLWAHEGYLFFADPPSSKVFRWIPGRKPEPFLEKSPGASGLGLDTRAQLYVCEARARRIVRFDREKRATTFVEQYQGKRLNAPNDVTVRRDGQVYFTDPAFGYQQDTRELDFYGIYHATPKGELSLVSKWTTRPNGIALAPNGRVLYIADSDRRSIRAYDLDRRGAASNERTLVTGIEGSPKGLAVDENGSLYVAAKNIYVYASNGKPVGKIQFGDPPTGCAFGEGDLQALYVTAGDSVYRVRLNVKGAVQY
jgi:gluconolactonase